MQHFLNMINSANIEPDQGCPYISIMLYMIGEANKQEQHMYKYT